VGRYADGTLVLTAAMRVPVTLDGPISPTPGTVLFWSLVPAREPYGASVGVGVRHDGVRWRVFGQATLSPERTCSDDQLSAGLTAEHGYQLVLSPACVQLLLLPDRLGLVAMGSSMTADMASSFDADVVATIGPIPGPPGLPGAVDRLYLTALGRRADAAGSAYWQGRIRRGEALGDVAAALLASPEGRARLRGLDDTRFLEQVYVSAFGRQPDVEGLAYWSEQLRHVARSEVVIALANSDEMRDPAAA
jgi:hypothetical protein